jgi:iron complex transport system permease protein
VTAATVPRSRRARGLVRRGSVRRGAVLLGIVALLGLVVALSLALGARAIPAGEVLRALVDPVAGSTDHAVVRDLRVPRTVIGLLAGLGLGLAGAVTQGITRNPLADPGLLGVSAGASLAVVIAITVGVTRPGGYIWFALAGAALASVLVYGIAAGGPGGPTPIALALAGTATGAAMTSVITVVLLSDVDALNRYRFWSVGSLVGRDLSAAAALWPYLAAGAVLAAGTARTLTALALGDDVARGLGQRVGLARAVAAVAVVLLAGTATALAGPILLLGLMVPHLARRLTGVDYRWVLAASAVIGPILLLGADVVGRVVIRPAELEAGLVVAFLGAPVLIALVRRARVSGL